MTEMAEICQFSQVPLKYDSYDTYDYVPLEGM